MIKVIKNSKYLILICLLMITSQTFGQGSRYTGTYKKSGRIEYVDKSNIVIEGLEFENSIDRSITLWSCNNITIKNCKFKNSKNEWAILAENSTNIHVIDCSFENVYAGFKAVRCKGNVKFEYNDVKNVVGNLYGGSANLQAVQFNTCTGADNSISFNSIENIEGESSPDDNINVFYSSGTPESPIRVANNWIRGGGPSASGGGILLGDWGGSYQIAENNIVVNPGQYGMGIAGGNNMTLRNNKIYSKKRAFTNVGLSICNWTADKTTGPSYNITVENNEINWTHRDGYLNIWWVYENMNHLKGLQTNFYNKDLTGSILPEIIIDRARQTNGSNPDENQPEIIPEPTITKVYIDSFNRIAIKYLVSSIPHAFAELYTSTGQLNTSMTLPRFNTAFPHILSPGEYFVKITYRDLNKTEINKIIIN